MLRTLQVSGNDVRLVRTFNGECFMPGKLRVYSPAKTVADCFKFRSKIGMETAIQALRSAYREKKATMDQIWNAAKVCRVVNVMRPYMESLV